MIKIAAVVLAVAACLWMAVGCSAITSPAELDEFSWSPMSDPETRVPGAEAMSALSLLYVQGRVLTPSRCYELSSEFQKEGDQLTVRITARPASGTNCDSGIGAFEYTAVISKLKRQTYDLRVVHDVQGGAGGEFNLTVAVVQ